MDDADRIDETATRSVDRSTLAALWARYAETGAGDDAPTYRTIARAVAGDPALLAVSGSGPDGTAHPNNLFAATRFLLAGDPTDDHRLGAVYRGDPDPDPFGAFRDFVLDRRAEIASVLGEWRIQTNEPARAMHIAAGLGLLQTRHGPLGLVDVGTSAGLNLMVDRMRIDYLAGERSVAAVGPVDAALRVACRLVAEAPTFPAERLDLPWRHGLDRSPIDLSDERARRWLRACVWADQRDRARRLDAAITLAMADPPGVTTGDAVDDLPSVLARAPGDVHLVVMTTWVAYYLPVERRRAFEDVLEHLGRPISWFSLEYPGVIADIDRPATGPDPTIVPSVLALVTHDPGEGTRREFLGWGHHHGIWLDWHG